MQGFGKWHKKVAGVGIHPDRLDWVELKPACATGAKPQVLAHASVPLSQGKGAGEGQSLVDAICSLRKKAKSNTQQVMACLPLGCTQRRVLHLEKRWNRLALEQHIRLDLDAYFNLPKTELVWDFEPLPVNEDNSTATEQAVEIVVARKNELEKLQTRMRQSGLQLLVVESVEVTLRRLYRWWCQHMTKINDHLLLVYVAHQHILACELVNRYFHQTRVLSVSQMGPLATCLESLLREQLPGLGNPCSDRDEIILVSEMPIEPAVIHAFSEKMACKVTHFSYSLACDVSFLPSVLTQAVDVGLSPLAFGLALRGIGYGD